MGQTMNTFLSSHMKPEHITSSLQSRSEAVIRFTHVLMCASLQKISTYFKERIKDWINVMPLQIIMHCFLFANSLILASSLLGVQQISYKVSGIKG